MCTRSEGTTNSFMGSWLVGKVQFLCIERGGKMPLEDVWLLISPHCRRHEARVGSVPPSSLLPRRFSSALRILFFRPADRLPSIVIKPIMIFVVSLV